MIHLITNDWCFVHYRYVTNHTYMYVYIHQCRMETLIIQCVRCVGRILSLELTRITALQINKKENFWIICSHDWRLQLSNCWRCRWINKRYRHSAKLRLQGRFKLAVFSCWCMSLSTLNTLNYSTSPASYYRVHYMRLCETEIMQ